MEMPSVRQLLPHAGEERYQMLELNKRLESYLGRVKLLEEENQLLRGEIQALQKNRDTKGRRQAHEEALSLARKEVQVAWMEKDRVELEMSNLIEEMEELNAQRQKERAAQAEAKKKLVENKKVLEDEWRTQIWLREQAAHLEKEVSLQVQVHQEEMASLKSTSAFSKSVPMAPQHSQTTNLQGLGKEYSQRAAQAWQEAAGVYQRQVEQLEDNLNQARAHLAQINQEKKENQLRLQDLVKELESIKVKRELLERNMGQQKDEQNRELQQLQAQVEILESEKVTLGDQIGDLLVDRRNLMQMKMCLGLEVATYRALLDSESLRVNGQPASKTSARTISVLETLSKPHGMHPSTQTISASSHLSSPLTTSRSITPFKANLMTTTPSWSLTQSTQETPKRVQNAKKEEDINKETATFERTSTDTLTEPLIGTGLAPFAPKEAHEVSCASSISACVVPPSVDEPKSTPSAHVTEDLEEILTENQSETGQDSSGAEEAALINLVAGHLSSLPQTQEREVPFNLHADDIKDSENGEEEETEVSTEMAQISHAPMYAWEENDTMKDIVSELELESENTSENYTQEGTTDTMLTDLKQLGEDTESLASPLFEQTPLHSVDAFSHNEKKSDTLTWEDDVTDHVTDIPGAESLESAPEVETVLTERCQETDRTEEVVEEEERCGTNVLDEHHSDGELQDEETKTDFEAEESNVEERKEEDVADVEEEKVADGEEWKVEEERKIDKDIVVIDEHFANTFTEASIQDSSALELEVDPHRNPEHTEMSELAVETSQENHLLVEDHAEEQIQSDEDESLNISASWRTDLGEPDSYAQENTLADTRPLIHYKSDEETDANTQASHMGVSEPSDSEDEREKHEAVLMWGQNTAKRFDTMEDLSEEPEIDSVVMEESVQTVVEENMDEMTNEDSVEPEGEDILQSQSTDVDMNVNLLQDDTLINVVENDNTNCEESCQGGEETENDQVVLVMKESVQTVVQENMDEMTNEDEEFEGEDILQSESTDVDMNVSLLKDDTSMNLAENANRNYEKSSPGEEEAEQNQVPLVMEESIQTAVEEEKTDEMTNEDSVEPEGEDIPSVDVDMNVHLLKDDTSMNLVENGIRHCEESYQGGEATEKDEVPWVLKEGVQIAIQQNTDEMTNEKSVESEGEDVSQTESTDMDINVNLLKDDTLMDLVENDNRKGGEDTEENQVLLNTEESVQAQVEENTDEMTSEDCVEPVVGDILQIESTDMDMNVNLLKDDTLMDLVENDNRKGWEDTEENQVLLDIEESVQDEVEENTDEMTSEDCVEPLVGDILQTESTDVDMNVSLLKDDTLMDLAENDNRKCEESSHGGEETKENQVVLDMEESVQTVVEEKMGEMTNEDSLGFSVCEDRVISETIDNTLMDLVETDVRNYEEISQGGEETVNNQVLLVQKQEEDSHLQDWSQSFHGETNINEQHTLSFEQTSSGEDDIAISNEKTEKCNIDSLTQIKLEAEGENGVKTHSDNFPLVQDTALPEPFPKQALEEECSEIPSTEATYSEGFPSETNLTKEQFLTKEEEDDQSNLSVLTHADFTDNLSLHSGLTSRPDSQTNIANSDFESNSSDDESPNASQCSQVLAGMSTELLDFSSTATSREASKNDSESFTDLQEDILKNDTVPQAAESENVSQGEEEEQLSVDNSRSGTHRSISCLPQMQEWEDLDHPDVITGASHNIFSAVKELSDMTMEDNKASEQEDIVQGNVLNEEPQTKEKENDLHSFFRSSLKEDIWSATKFEMAATFDSKEPTDTTHTTHPKPSMTFEEDWGELGSLKPANGKHEEEMSMTTVQSEEEEDREEHKIPQAKQLQCRDVKDGQMEAVQSDDSVDDGDSWSSGEE